MNGCAALLLTGSLGLAGCSADQVVIDFPRIGIEAAQAAAVDRATTVLHGTCPGIARYRSEYKPVSARRSAADSTDQREIGWEQVTVFEVAVNPLAQGDVARLGATGHTCRFAVGDGAPVGVSTAKRACLSLCTGRASEQSYGFIPMPAERL